MSLSQFALIWLVLNPIGIVSKGASQMIAWNICLVPIGAPRITFVVSCLVSLFIGKTFANNAKDVDAEDGDSSAELISKVMRIETVRWTFVLMIYLVSLFA